LGIINRRIVYSSLNTSFASRVVVEDFAIEKEVVFGP
jgi:hypothetical protein